MGVVSRVTRDARSWKGNLRDVLLSMARRASQPGMRAGQRKVRLLAVVEPPDRPAVWCVAGAASAAKTAFVMCVAVAAGTGSRCVLVGSRLVTLFAWNDGVLAEKWKAREIVVESHFFAPACLVMALLAGRPELACVRVVLFVAGHAGCSELIFVEIAGVTGFAAGGRVAAL